jgi:hypothetical protein
MSTELKAQAGLSDWYSLEGEAFVRQAYLQLLGRSADPSGLKDYVEQLRAGKTKAELAAELEDSPEGQAAARRRATAAGARRASVPEKPLENSAAHAVTEVTQVNDLFAMHGSAFVRAAYMALFGRTADPQGLARYAGLLRSGFSRSFIIDALATSPEALEKSRELPGLKQLLKTYRNGQDRGWKGWYWRNVKGAESDLIPAREARLLAFRETSVG